MANTKWKDLSPAQRRMIGAAAAVQIGLSAATLIDLRRRTPEQVRGPKRLWKLAAFVNFAGPIAYFTLGRRKR